MSDAGKPLRLDRKLRPANPAHPDFVARPPGVPVQGELDKILSRGIFFSIMWLMGFGSLYAFRCGLRARRMIRASNGALRGRGRAWWCLIVGGIGMAIWFPAIIVGIVDNIR